MGFQNTQTKNYIRQNDHFADLCNYFLFDGQDVIRPEELEERDVTELALPQWIEGAATLERIRDVLRTCTVKSARGITYLVVGVENQTDVHYANSEQGMREFLKVYDGVDMGNDARNLINSCVNAKLKLIEKDGDEKVCKGMIELMGTERREGMKEGMKTQLQLAISSMRKKGMDVKDIAYYLEISEEEVRNIGVIGK